MIGRVSARWMAAVAALLVWALAAGSALFWYLRVGSVTQSQGAPVAGSGLGMTPADAQQVARALGATDAAPAAEAPPPDVLGRLALRGVVTQGGQGAALIAVDGKPPKPLRVGAGLPVEGDWRVQALEPHAVVLAAGDRQARLQMPEPGQRKSGTARPEGAAPTQGPQPVAAEVPAGEVRVR